MEAEILFDSGASISVISQELCKKNIGQSSGTVLGIGGQQKVGPPVIANICFSSEFKAEVTLKPMKIAGKDKLIILGRDFLTRFGITQFDWERNRIKLGEDWVFFLDPPKSTPVYQVGELDPEHDEQLKELLESRRSVFAINNKAPRLSNTGMHVIKSIDDQIQREKVRRIPIKWIPEVNAQVKEMFDNGIIRKSCSPYNNNILLVDKSDKTKRFVLDFRNLNKNTKPDNYPLPNVEEMIESCYGSKYFSQIDFASGYWAIPLNKRDCEKTAFSTPRGKYECLVMPFGLLNAQATFQRTVDEIIVEMKEQKVEGLDGYSDNIILHSRTLKEHLYGLSVVLEVIEKHNLSLREDKCQFCMKEITFLGFVINGTTVKPDPKNIEKMVTFPTPTSRKKVQQFIGLAGFNRKFVKDMAEVIKPLTDLTSNKVPFIWTNVEQHAFDEIKKKLGAEALLYLPNWNEPFNIRCDASDFSMGAILYQEIDNQRRTVAYASKALTNEKLGWSTTDKELWALLWVTRKWKVYCCTKPTIYSDHLSLQQIRNQKDPRGKIARWIIELGAVDCTLKFLKGTENVEADCLSRVLFARDDIELENEQVVYTIMYPSLENIKAEQEKDVDLKSVKEAIKADKKITTGPYRKYANISIKDGVLHKGSRIMIPDSLQEQITKEMHGQYHYGAPNTLEMIKNHYYWRDMKKQIFSLVMNCESCIKCKPSKDPKAELVLRDIPHAREVMSMDVGSMPLSKAGNVGFLVMVDMCTKFLVVAAIKNQRASTLERAICDRYLPYLGTPLAILSDKGKSIDGNFITTFCENHGIKKAHSSAYHPEGNGSAENAVKIIKGLTRSMCDSRKMDLSDWDTVLYDVVMGANNMVSRSSEYSPYKCMFGAEARLPVHNLLQLERVEEEECPPKIIQDNARLNKEEAGLNYKRYYDKDAETLSYEIDEEVLVKRCYGKYPKASVKWVKGPYIIKGKVGPVNYKVIGPAKFGKVLHHNNIRKMRAEVEATKTAQLADVPDEEQPLTYITINRESFRRNVFNNNHALVPERSTEPAESPVTIIGPAESPVTTSEDPELSSPNFSNTSSPECSTDKGPRSTRSPDITPKRNKKHKKNKTPLAVRRLRN